MGRRVLNRKEMRADFDAAERQKEEGELDESEELDEEEEEDEDEADGEADAEDEADEDEEDEAPKKRKKAAAKPKAKPRTRAAKVVRLKAVWAVFSNSNQRVATYEYPKRKEAEDHAARLTNDKKSTHFVQMIKEPMEEKKEA
jgi:hypothetical protein